MLFTNRIIRFKQIHASLRAHSLWGRIIGSVGVLVVVAIKSTRRTGAEQFCRHAPKKLSTKFSGPPPISVSSVPLCFIHEELLNSIKDSAFPRIMKHRGAESAEEQLVDIEFSSKKRYIPINKVYVCPQVSPLTAHEADFFAPDSRARAQSPSGMAAFSSAIDCIKTCGRNFYLKQLSHNLRLFFKHTFLINSLYLDVFRKRNP